MGLQSAMTTALTGLQAAETTIDVVGNNVANSNTIGFKESNVLFSTQFLQTQSIGSAPTGGRGGTNPRQIGLGAKVAAINPDFTQGTIEISANPLDVAIQGDGFLIVQGNNGEEFYTRNGQLQTNASNEIVTATGNRVLGFTVDENFVPQTDILRPLTIPLGEEVVAQATETAYLAGRLSPTADAATTPGMIQSEIMGDSTQLFPLPGSITIDDFSVIQPPNASSVSLPVPAAGGTLNVGSQYAYRLTYYENAATQVYESPSSVEFGQTTISTLGDQTIPLSGIPVPGGNWDGRYLYRSVDGGPFQRIADLGAAATTFNDNGSAVASDPLNDDSLNVGNYGYYVTWGSSTEDIESRPTPLLGSFSVSDANRSIRIEDLPQPPGTNVDFDQINIYRNTTGTGGASTYYKVTSLPVGETLFIDNVPDADIIAAGEEINLMGPTATEATRLIDVVVRNGSNYESPFVEGTLSFTGTKGVRNTATKELTITETTTLSDLRNFMDQALGINTPADSVNAGGAISSDGRLQFTSNLGIENELGVSLSAFQMRPAGTDSAIPTTLSFESTQEANGGGTTADFIVYDSLGIPLTVRLTTALESKTGTSTTYRWYATSSSNEEESIGSSNVDTVTGFGTIVFDGKGNITSGEIGNIAIDRNATASNSPLVVALDFKQMSGLAESESNGNSSMNLKLQDGFSAGTLTSFIISESGSIRGVYSNGAERGLGQITMAKFANNSGLQQVGENLFIQGVNSGNPQRGNPGELGLGNLTAGAVELSNTDIGQNLIELILASTQYRGGTRVITAAQELLDELMALRR